jgi:hypothetical protein
MIVASIVFTLCGFETFAESASDEYEQVSDDKALTISRPDEEINLAEFPNLTELRVAFCNGLTSVKNIPQTLEALEIENSDGVCLENLEDRCPNLKRLAVRECENASLTGRLPNALEELSLEVCENITLETEFSGVKKLTLADTKFKNPLHLNLATFSRLEEAQIYGCENFMLGENFPPPLKILRIMNNCAVPFAINLADCANLEEPSVSREVISVDLGGNSNLKSLQVHESQNFNLLGEPPKNLEYVDFFQVSFSEESEENANAFVELVKSSASLQE